MRETSLASGEREPVAASGRRMWLPLFLVVAGIVAGWGILSFPAVKVLAVGLGVLCIIIAAWRIDLALYGAGFFLVILQEAETTPGTIFTFLERLNRPNIPSLLEVIFAVIAAAFAVRLFIMGEEGYTLRGMRIALALFFTILLISFAVGVGEGTDHTTRKEDFKRFIFPIIFFVSAINILDTRRKVVNLLSVMFWAMLVKIFLADFFYLKGLGFPYGDSHVVFLESGDQILLVTIIVAGISLMAERAWDWKQWLFLLCGLPPTLFALIFSYRRNALWGTIFSLGLLFLLSERRKRAKLFKVFALAGAAALLLVALLPVTGGSSSSEFLKRRLVSVVDRDESSNRAHVNEWEVTIKDTMERPLFGLGLGSVHREVPDFEVLNRHTVHNAFLMLWMKLGIFALAAFLWYLYLYARLGARESLRSGDPLLAGLFATCAHWFVSMNAGPAWFYYRESCLIALMIAVVIRLSTRQQEG